VAKECRIMLRNSQQRELLPVFTAFPFNPLRLSGALREPMRCKSNLFSEERRKDSCKKSGFRKKD
jgi:hypothetical protein